MSPPKRKGRRTRPKARALPVSGKKLNPQSSIRDFTSIPNYTVVLGYEAVVKTDDGSYFLYSTDILSNLHLQFNRKYDENLFRARVRSINIYNLTSNTFTVYFREMLLDGAGNNSVVSTITDFASPMTYAKVGYLWPLAQQQIFHGPSDPKTTILNITARREDKLVFRINLLWSFVAAES